MTVCLIRVPEDIRDSETTRTFYVEQIEAECVHPDGTQTTDSVAKLDKFVAIPANDFVDYVRYCGGKE